MNTIYKTVSLLSLVWGCSGVWAEDLEENKYPEPNRLAPALKNKPSLSNLSVSPPPVKALSIKPIPLLPMMSVSKKPVSVIATLQKTCAPWEGRAFRITAQTAEGPVFLASIWAEATYRFEAQEWVRLSSKAPMNKTAPGLALRCENNSCHSIDLEIRAQNIFSAVAKGESSSIGEEIIPFLLTLEKVKSEQICHE